MSPGFKAAAKTLLSLLLLSLCQQACGAVFTASIEPNLISLGSAASLQLRFEDGSPTEPIQLPAVPGLRFATGGRMNETTMVNGRWSQALVLNYQAIPSRTGTFTIPPIAVTVDGRSLTSQALTLTVVTTDPALAQIAFLSLSFPKRNYFVGETTAAQLDLHAQGGKLIQLPQLTGDGAIFGTNVAVGQAQRVSTNNGIYFRQSWRVPVTFTKAGNFSYTAENCQLQVDFRRQPRGNSIWSMLPDIESRTLNLNTEPALLQVRGLPSENVPPDFSGAVGRFTLKAELSTTNVNAGDPVTLTVRLSGIGNLDALRWSTPTNWPGLKAYDPTSRLEISDELGLVGTRIFEQVLIPESTATRSIPPFHFSYFDPNRASYQTEQHPGFPLEVHATTVPAAQPVVAASTSSATDDKRVDIVHIKNLPGSLALSGPPLYARPWFILLQLIPPAFWFACLLWRRRLDRLASNPRELRHLRVTRQLRRGLQSLQRHSAQGDAAAFYSEVFRLLQEQLGERLDLPASSITGAIVDEHLRRPDTDPDLAQSVDELFAACDQARYSPHTTREALDGLLPKIENTLRRIQRLQTPAPHLKPRGPTTLLLFTSLTLGHLATHASSPQESILLANKLYEQAQYHEAASAYQALLTSGWTSPALHFNLGNTYFRLGEIGLAIAEYRAAAELDPRDPDIAANLRFARQQVTGSASVKPNPLLQHLQVLSFQEWIVLSSLALWLLFCLLALAQLRPSWKSRLRPWTLTATGITPSLLALTAFVAYRTRFSKIAIVVQPELPIHYGPLDESQVHFTVSNGTELDLLNLNGDWVQVTDAAHRSGWTRNTNLVVIPPLRPQPTP